MLTLPRRHAPARRLVLLLLLALLPSCVQTVRGQETQALRDLREPIRSVAVAPFTVSDRMVLRGDAADPDTQAALVARHFSEALRARGVEVVAPSDLARVLGGDGSGPQLPGTVVATAGREFGVDAVVIGQLTRFVEKQTQAAGATRPASVGFRVTLYAVPGGERLWTGAFDETQQPLTENVLSASRYPGGGMRWLSAEELARWGAQQTAADMPLGW